MVLFSFFRFRMHGRAAAGQRTHCVSDAAGHLIPSLIHCLQTGGSPFPSLSNPKNPPGRAAYLQNSAGSVLINQQECSLRLRPLFLCNTSALSGRKKERALVFLYWQDHCPAISRATSTPLAEAWLSEWVMPLPSPMIYRPLYLLSSFSFTETSML